MGLVLEKVRKTTSSQPSLKRADCWLFSLPPSFQEVVRNSPRVTSVYQLTPEEERLLEGQRAWKTWIMCEGQERRAGAPERRVEGWVPALLSASCDLAQFVPQSLVSATCRILLPELSSQMERDAGGFPNACLVLMAHISKTILCLQDQNLHNKVGRILNQVRASGF